MRFGSTEKTDELRRLALQLAIQLPENVAEARRVLGLAGELLEGFMVEGDAGSPLDRARRLGWRHGVLDQAELDRPAPAAPSRVQALGWSLATLLLTVPAAVLLEEEIGAGAGLCFGAAVVVVAMLFGRLPAAALAIVNPVAHNLLVTPPALSFQAPSGREMICGAFYVLIALALPPLIQRLPVLRRLAARPRPTTWPFAAARSAPARESASS